MAKVTEHGAAARRGSAGAVDIAVAGLTFLAGDPDQLERFMAVTGVEPGQVRSMAADPAFLGAVLEFICADEEILLPFARAERMKPETVDQAREALNGRWERDSA